MAILVVPVASYGLMTLDAYRAVPELTRATWRAQDAVCLVAAPLMVAVAVAARRGSLRAHVALAGLFTWFAYGYAHLALAAPFNRAFLGYVAILLLSAFGALDGLLRVDAAAAAAALARAPRRASAWFLLVAGIGVAGLWLSDIVPALLTGTLPGQVHLAELPNPTWVLDLAWIVPAALASARLLLLGRAAGPLVAGSLLVMLLVLSASMLAVTPFALAEGLGDDPDVRPQLVAFTVVFAVLGALELGLVLTGWRRSERTPVGWRRAGWWC